MNRSYRSVWNESLGAWVATSEVTAARGKKSSSNRALVSSSVLASVLAAAALMPSLALADTVNDTYGVCLRSTGQGTWTCEVPVAGGGVARISGVPDAYNGPDAAFVNNWAAQNLGANALAIGNLLTQATGESSIAIGNAAKAQAEASTAIGTSAQAIANRQHLPQVYPVAAPTPLSTRFNAWLREYFAMASSWLLGEV